MEIYILRHGLAGEASEWAPKPDWQRPLTEEGRKKIKKIAKFLKRADVDFDRILTSPYLRAKQTAEIVAKSLKLEKKLSLRQTLASEASPKSFAHALGRQGCYWRSVLVVGHEPFLSQLISLWVAGNTDAISVTLKKGGLCKLSVRKPQAGRCATLEWLVPPKVLLQ